jgi:hypothetical protein
MEQGLEIKDEIHKLDQAEQSARDCAVGKRDVQAGMNGGRFWCERFLYGLNCCQETISPAGERFYVPWAGRGISQGFAHFIDGGVETVIEIYEGIGGPQFLAKFFAGDDFTRALQQE